MKKVNVVLYLIAGLSAASPVSAAELGLSLDAGTPGVGLHLSTPIADAVNLRVGVNYYKGYSFTRDTERVNYDLKLKLNTFDALIDWFPARSEFRLTGGLVYDRNKVDGIGHPKVDGTFSVQGETYNFNQLGKIDGLIDFRSVAPYLGIGWGNPVADKRGWSFATDVGVMYQGSPNVTLGTSGCTLPGSVCSLLNVVLAPTIRAETDRLNDDFKRYRFFPVIRVGVTYRF